MPSIIDNKEMFSGYDWSAEGHEWSSEWGSSDNLWHAEIYPRIAPFIANKKINILEIACGYGRMSNYLLDYSNHLTLLDINENCIDFCKNKFSKFTNLSYIKNDGYSFEGVEDSSVEFVFSYDSSVHVDEDVIRAYIKEIKRVLKLGGIAFIHHSNLGSYKEMSNEGYINLGFRSSNVSQELVKSLSISTGLECLAQELLVWNCFIYTDCFTWLSNSDENEPCKLKINPYFKDHAKYIRNFSIINDYQADTINCKLPATIHGYVSAIKQIVLHYKIAVWGNSGKIYEMKSLLSQFDINIELGITEKSDRNYSAEEIGSILGCHDNIFVIVAFDILREDWRLRRENAKNILSALNIDFLSIENIYSI
jgi:ubiquinone/menaquinone biosynthesis C-methylase UbiE